MRSTCARMVLACTAVVVLASTGWAQQDKDKDRDRDGGHRHPPPAAANASVDFGILPLTPIGPLPCLQAGAIGGPADPCSYQLHRLSPDEVTIRTGGQVTFQIHGGGHAFAIYEVSKSTKREELGQFLCAGEDPATVTDPAAHPCNLNAANANAKHIVLDGRGKVVLVAEPNLTNVHPDTRVWSEEDRLMSAGGQQFLNGGTIPAGPTSNGQLVTYRFLEDGRYLVICMNRVHFLNDWMFGFVDVEGRGHD
jgi:hypothetical protein